MADAVYDDQHDIHDSDGKVNNNEYIVAGVQSKVQVGVYVIQCQDEVTGPMSTTIVANYGRTPASLPQQQPPGWYRPSTRITDRLNALKFTTFVIKVSLILK